MRSPLTPGLRPYASVIMSAIGEGGGGEPALWPRRRKLRVRSPSFLHGNKISQVAVGGQPWGQFNASEETILFKSVTDEMQHIVVTFASHARVVGAEI